MKFLSDEWCAMYTREAATLDPAPGVSGTVEMALRADDETSRAYLLHFVDGRVASVEPRSEPDADLHYEVPDAAYRAFCVGDREPWNKASLNGQIRMTGYFDRASPLRHVTMSRPFTEVLGRVHAQTEY